MKAQYERFVAWQKDVERVHEEHKEKFREAKRFIETVNIYFVKKILNKPFPHFSVKRRKHSFKTGK